MKCGKSRLLIAAAFAAIAIVGIIAGVRSRTAAGNSSNSATIAQPAAAATGAGTQPTLKNQIAYTIGLGEDGSSGGVVGAARQQLGHALPQSG